MSWSVYAVTCKINQKLYIGVTSRSVKLRWQEHCTKGGSPALVRAISKYGRDAFSVECLGFGMSKDVAYFCEIDLIAGLGTLVPGGYNLSTGGEGKGCARSIKTRAKMSAARQGKKMHRGTKAKLLAANKGRKQTPDHIAKVQESRKGYRHSDETRAKISASRTGRIGRPHSDEHKAKVSASLRGRTKTPETIAKMSAAQKTRRANERGCE